MGMGQRPRFPGPAPGGPQGMPGLRPMGSMPGYPTMMRAGNPQQMMPQQQRFQQNVHPSAGPMPGSVPMNPVRPSQLPPSVPQQQRMIPAVPAGPTGPSIGSVRPNQVQYSMAARNIQMTANPVGPVRSVGAEPVSDGLGAPQPMIENGGTMDQMSIDEFMLLVQSKPSNDQKQLLGEKLYSVVNQWYPQLAGKLTGMLLEIDNRELMAMILEHYKTGAQDSSNTLRNKCESALQVLSKAQASSEVPKRDGDAKASD